MTYKPINKTASFFLSKRASYSDEVLESLERKPILQTTTTTGLKEIPGVDINKAYQIISTLESNGGYVVGDSGTSFGATQVQFGSFVSKLAAHPEVQRVTGISSEEYRKLAESWGNFSQKMRGANIWLQTSVDEEAVKAFAKSNPKSVVARKEGTTIRFSTSNMPGVVKIKGGRYIGYVLDVAKLKGMGLGVDSPYMMSQLKLLTDQFITDGVVRNGIVKLFVAQNNPAAYSKFQRTFSRKSVMANKDIRRVADIVSQQDFMNRVNAVVNSVAKSGYDVTAPGAYNIYQLIAVSNAAGVGAVQNFLFNKRPFSKAQTHYLNRANVMIGKVTGIASVFPPNDGLNGFVRTASIKDEWGEEKTPVTTNITSEMVISYDVTLRRLREELYKNRELMKKVWTEYEEELGRKIDRRELAQLIENDVAKYIQENWDTLKEKKAMLSKRAAYNTGALYFPSQYAEEIKSGKRQMTIRANDIPVQVDEVVKCMTYSGAHVCDVKITSKETMSIGRIQKAFGKHIARSLEQKFGKERRFVVIRFEQFKNINEADDLPEISFSPAEHKKLEHRLRSGKGIYTTRIGKERGKYKEGREFMTPWGHKVRVVNVVQLDGVENHPFLDELTDEQKEQVGKRKYDLIRLEKSVCNEADDEDDKKWEEVFIEKDDISLTRKQIRDHYEKPDIRKKIMARIKGKPILVYIGIGKNQKVLKRNHDNKQIVITNDDAEKGEDPHNYFYWTKLRLLSIHEVFGTKTDIGFVDLDIHSGFEFKQAEKYAHELSGKIKEKFGGVPTLYQSGGSGIHIEFGLKDEMQINDLRKELKELLDEFNEDWDGVTTSVVKGKGMRSDVSTLHNKGSLRVPWALGETYGKVKKPLGKSQDDDDYNNNTWGMKNITEPNFPPADGVIQPPTGGTEVSPTGNVGFYNMTDDGTFAMSIRGGIVKIADRDIVEEYLWLWDGQRLHTSKRVYTDASGKIIENQVWHYDLLMKAGIKKYDDKLHPRGFVTFYKNRKPEITTYRKVYWKLPTRLQDRLERMMDLVPGGYTTAVIDPDRYDEDEKEIKVNEQYAYERLNMIWKLAAKIDDDAEKFFKEHPELMEESEEETGEEPLGFGSEEEEEATRRPIKKTPLTPIAPAPKPVPQKKEPKIEAPKEELKPELPKEEQKLKIKPVKKTFKDIVEPTETPKPVKKTKIHDRLIDELLGEIVEKVKEPTKAPDKEDIISQLLAGEDEDIGKEILEQPSKTERFRPSIFGKIEPLADDKGKVIEKWPEIASVPKMSDEIRLYFTPENLSTGQSLRKLFMDPKVWELLRKERHLVQEWILPAIVMTIGKKWFDISSVKNTVERTPFKMFDENDAEAIEKGVLVEDLPKTRKYVQEINRILAKVLNTYFAIGYSGMPIDGYCYTALRRAMTQIIAEDNHYKEIRYPVCSVCKVQKAKGAEVPRMERTATEKNLWTCLECKRKADQLENVDLSDIENKISKIKNEINKIKYNIMQAEISYEDVEEDQKQNVAERLSANKKRHETLKLELPGLEEKRKNIVGEIRKLHMQTNVPYMHTWCPNEACPGRRVPLTSIDWNSPFWKTSTGQDVRMTLKDKMEIVPPGDWEQNAMDLSESGSEIKGNEPPAWMLDVPFICPHDGVHFTLRDARGKGEGQKGGFFWKPYQRSEWIRGERAGAGEMAEVGVDNDVDEKIAYQQLGKLARNIFLKKYWDVYNSVMKYVTTEKEKGRTAEHIERDQTYISLRRRLALYDTARDFSALNSEVFVGWLAGREFGRQFVREGKTIKNKSVIKNRSLLSEKKEEIYLPLLQQWVDKMLSEPNGYEKYHIDNWLTSSSEGIPHLDDGAYFVTKIGKTAETGFNGFEYKLKTRSAKNTRLLRVLGVWGLTASDAALLKKIDSKIPGVLKGTAAIQNSETVRKLLKDKQNRIGEFSGHDFSKVSLDAEEGMFSPGEYVLVKALIMPEKSHNAPLESIKALRKDSDDDDIFYQFGMEAAGHNDDPSYWKQLNKMLSGLKSPEEMRTNLETFMKRQEKPKEEEEGDIAPIVTVTEEGLNETYKRWLEISKKKKPERRKQLDITTVSLEDLEKGYNKYMELLAKKKQENDAKDPLSTYKKKRKFDETPEPEGEVGKKNKHRFVIQDHHAETAGQHYDLRLENDKGAMSSWSLPKHKMPKGNEKLLAVKVEDHPVSYNKFEGEIPEGYGKGKVSIQSSGTYEEIEWSKSKIVFKLKGGKEKGTYNLIHTDGNKWLLMKSKKDS